MCKNGNLLARWSYHYHLLKFTCTTQVTVSNVGEGVFLLRAKKFSSNNIKKCKDEFSKYTILEPLNNPKRVDMAFKPTNQSIRKCVAFVPLYFLEMLPL